LKKNSFLLFKKNWVFFIPVDSFKEYGAKFGKIGGNLRR
jgi:hypothetical protein